jgi:hypothetical protein
MGLVSTHAHNGWEVSCPYLGNVTKMAHLVKSPHFDPNNIPPPPADNRMLPIATITDKCVARGAVVREKVWGGKKPQPAIRPLLRFGRYRETSKCSVDRGRASHWRDAWTCGGDLNLR